MSLKKSNICNFFTQSRKIYTWQNFFTQTCLWCLWQIWGMAVTFHLLSVCKCRVTNLQAYLLQTLIENKQSLTKATSAIQLLFITKFHSISFQLSGSIFFRVAIINTFKVTDSISIPDDYSIFFQDDSNISFRYDASISFHDDSQFLV